MTNDELSLIIPTFGRAAKLRTLLQDIAATAADHEAFEVIVVVDDLDDAPLEASSALPRSIRFVGLTQTHKGPAAARNLALRHAAGAWVLFLNDDARVHPGTIPGHLELIRQAPHARQAYLGRFDFLDELIDSPWRMLLAETSMLFFWNTMEAGRTYGYRHFWTSNLSVRADLVRAVGGFCEQFTDAIHEDIELGWRLQRHCGLEVCPTPQIDVGHDHGMLPRDYFLREYRSGVAAQRARTANGEFHDDVWGWIEDAKETLDLLRGLFTESARKVRRLLEDWSLVSDHRPCANDLQLAYLAHLPLKRMVFCQGYVGKPFDDLWNTLH